MTVLAGPRRPVAPGGPPAAVGESNPTNRTCALCGTPTGGTGLLCGACVILPVPAVAR